MPAKVAFIARYPVKGLSPQPLDEVRLEKDQPFPGDRLFAVENGPSGYDPAAPAFAPKNRYLVLMGHPKLAAYATHYDDATGVLTISDGGGVRAAGDLSTEAGCYAIEAFYAEALAGDLRGAPKVLTATGDYRFMDSPASGFVSLLNLASVRALAEHAGVARLDPARFRMNFGIEGLPPWGEFDWVGREIALGAATLRVLKPTKRCAAINAAPGRGGRDLDLLPVMAQKLGHLDMGVYAEVVRGGVVRVGDGLEEASPRLL